MNEKELRLIQYVLPPILEEDDDDEEEDIISRNGKRRYHTELLNIINDHVNHCNNNNNPSMKIKSIQYHFSTLNKAIIQNPCQRRNVSIDDRKNNVNNFDDGLLMTKSENTETDAPISWKKRVAIVSTISICAVILTILLIRRSRRK